LGVASQWRIRHKLMLGVGLVVCVMALQLAGTLVGLLSYSATMKSIDSKLLELDGAERLKEEIAKLNSPYGGPAANYDEELDKWRKQMEQVRAALHKYAVLLRETVNRGRDPDKGYHETQYIEELRKGFDSLDKMVNQRPRDRAGTFETEEISPVQNEVGKALTSVGEISTDLRWEIYGNLIRMIKHTRGPARLSMGVVVTSTFVGTLLMTGLLRFFYTWVFYPIRDLERGVGRVAHGDFAHRIVLHSGDEMEDLAVAFNDMTSRLDEMYRDLAHQVNERSRQLVRSERLASVGFLAAGVAHEINNPLASIAFCSEALESRLADIRDQIPEQSEVITKYLRMIQEEAFRCKAITQRLLEFSRGSDRRRAPTDLAELIQSVLDMVQHLQNYKDKQIIFEPAGPITAWVNAQEIKSVVLNLVVNALDSLDENGSLTITLGQHAGMAELVFADTGCGMSPEILENIFEPFFTRSRTGKGTGLGLTISHRIITQHGGEIEAASPGLNQGSTFTVRLPLQPAESVKEETLAAA
jgi:signal transduction histidine kinase/uncharacterized protein YukE